MIAPAEKAPRVAAKRAAPRYPPAGPPDRRAAAAELSAEDKARAEKLVAQGDRYLEQGNIALAREFFHRAAEAGFAAGAIRMAATYDPIELERLQQGAGRGSGSGRSAQMVRARKGARRP